MDQSQHSCILHWQGWTPPKKRNSEESFDHAWCMNPRSISPTWVSHLPSTSQSGYCLTVIFLYAPIYKRAYLHLLRCEKHHIVYRVPFPTTTWLLIVVWYGCKILPHFGYCMLIGELLNIANIKEEALCCFYCNGTPTHHLLTIMAPPRGIEPRSTV